MLSANIVRKHFPADISLAGPYNVAQQMPLSSALQFLGVWSGPMALAGSRPVYVCLQTIYGLNSGVFSVNPLCICLILTEAWFGTLSRVCLHAYYPVCCLLFCPPGYVHLYVKCYWPIPEVWTVLPQRGHKLEYDGALSRRVHAFT